MADKTAWSSQSTDSEESPPHRNSDWQPVTPIPADTSPAPTIHPNLGPPSSVFPYRDEAGELLGYVWRFDPPSGEKTFLPLTWCARESNEASQWRFRSWEVPRPLYGLDRLGQHTDDATVIIFEGEKAADAGQKLVPDCPCLTSPNGSNAARKANWSVLARRKVVIWFDADAAGVRYAADVIAELESVGASVFAIEPPDGVSKGWDAADAIDEGWDQEQTRTLIDPARPAADWLVEKFGNRNTADGKAVDGGNDRGSSTSEDDDARADCPLLALGHFNGRYWFLSPAGEVRSMSGEKMNARGLATLVDGEVGWFLEHFGSEGRAGLNDYVAADWLRRACRKAGLFDQRHNYVARVCGWTAMDRSLTLAMAS